MERITYFENPTQVRFYDGENECYLGGIAFHEKLICGCCGGTIDLEDFYADYDEVWRSTEEEKEKLPANPIEIYSNWVNISEAITG